MTRDIMEQKYQGPHTIKNIHFAKDVRESNFQLPYYKTQNVQFSTTITNISNDTKKSIAHS